MQRKLAWLLFVALVLVTLAIVAIPVWLIQPFKPQTTRALEVSYTLRRWSPYVTAGSLLAVMLLIGWLWRGARKLTRAFLIVALVPLLLAVWFARQNHFEWMFNPLPHSVYAKAAEVDYINDTDMVLAVEVNGEAVAYPVRLMAYHHLVLDTVGGKPIVATY